MQFKYYVLNYDTNMQKIERFNIFQNSRVQEWSEAAVKKYIRSPKNFKYTSYSDNKVYTGFEGLCLEIKASIMNQEWGRREYEISVGDAFETDCDKLTKVDCFYQAELNIPMIVREIIWQYKEQMKNQKTE